jgi:hypothetical protein
MGEVKLDTNEDPLEKHCGHAVKSKYEMERAYDSEGGNDMVSFISMLVLIGVEEGGENDGIHLAHWEHKYASKVPLPGFKVE